MGLSTCKKIAEALNGDIFLVDDEETDEITLAPTKSDILSNSKPKKSEGTAIALVLKCPELIERFKDRHLMHKDLDNLLNETNVNVQTDNCKVELYDSKR